MRVISRFHSTFVEDIAHDEYMNLQELVEHLARDIGRAVVINDTNFVPLASSAQGHEIDQIRVESLLQHSTPEPALSYLRSLNLDRALSPVTVPLAQFGGLERLCVPVRDASGPLGYFWLITENQKKLPPTSLNILNVAVDVARELLRDTGGPAGVNRAGETASRLLADDASERITAYQAALDQGLLSFGPSTLITAVLLGDGADTLRVTAMARQVMAGTASRSYFAGLRPGAAFFVTKQAATSGDHLQQTIMSESTKYDVAVVGMGWAEHDGAAVDLEATGQRALTAARLSALLPEFSGGVAFESLGAWLLLVHPGIGGELVGQVSAAADYLLAPNRTVQRATVETFLEAGGSARVACEKLNIHRTTLYYRLETMDPIVNEALADGWKRTSLHVALSLARLRELRATT